MSQHLVIIGAGIVGAATALEALSAGFRVTILDPGPPGGEQAASYGNGCWLSPMSVIPPSTPGLWKKLPGYLSDADGPLVIRWSALPGLLPDLTPAEALEVSLVHSVAGMLSGGKLIRRPPFRDPHHSASVPALVGGGHRAKPGEISLSHLGVLFLDEWPEFPRPALEALRQPMETGRTTISRANAHVSYPARFQCIAAMNPCRCGYLGDAARECARAPGCAGPRTRASSTGLGGTATG
jgi:hypothetical protein